MKHNVMKRTLAGVMAVLCVAAYLPANVGTGGLFGGTGIVANATYTMNISLEDLYNNETAEGTRTVMYPDYQATIVAEHPSDGTKLYVSIRFNGSYIYNREQVSWEGLRYTVPAGASISCRRETTDGWMGFPHYIINITKAKVNQNPSISATDKVYDGTVASCSASGGYGDCTMKYTGINGTSYDSSSAPSAAGSYRFTVSYAGNPEYNSWTGSRDFTISKAESIITGKPSAKELDYDGSAQALVNAGSASGGTMQYSLDGTNYSTAIPTGTNAEDYTVYYKVVGDSNHNDTAAETVAVTISKVQASETKSPKEKTGLVYTGQPQALVEAGETNDGKWTYMLNGVWSDDIPTATNAGTYTVNWQIEPDSNHYTFAVAGDWGQTVTIAKADPSYTVPSGLTATFGQKLSDVALPKGWTWADSSQSVGNAGENAFKATFTPTDTANYNTISNVDVTVAVGHVFTAVGKQEPTCTENGYKAYWKDEAGNMYSDAEGKNLITAPAEIPATGHTPAEAVRENEVAPTYTTDGSYDEVVYCSVCGAEISRETITIPKLKVTYTPVDAVSATCTTVGNSAYYTGSDGKYYVLDGEEYKEIEENSWVIPATGHKLTKTNAKAATINAEGNIAYWTCSECGKIFSDENGTTEITLEDTVIPKLTSYEIKTNINGKTTTKRVQKKKSTTVTAPAVEGEKFSHWEVNGKKVSTSAKYSFIVLKNTEVTAVYVDAADEIKAEPVLNISTSKTTSNGKNAINFLFTRSIPEGYTVQEAGILYATNKLAGAKTNVSDYATLDLTKSANAATLNVTDVEDVVKNNRTGKVKKCVYSNVKADGTISLTYVIGANTTAYVYAVGYVKATNAEGKPVTLYTDFAATNYTNS